MKRDALSAILFGGLIAGFCDLTYAITYYAMRGVQALGPHFVWTDFLVHLFLIGLPIALLARRYSPSPFSKPHPPAMRALASGDLL